MSLKSALAGGGLLLASLSFLAGTQIGEQVEPLEQGKGLVSSPAGVGCPDGWQGDQVTDDATAHTQTSCRRGDWIVYLTADGKFGFAWDGKSPEFITDSSQVPGW